MKTRRVIQKLKVKDGEFFYEGIGYGSMGVEREKFPDGTEAELAVYVDSPPKRELVVPEGISWQRNLMRHEKEGQEYLLSINDDSLIGSVREYDDKWFWRAGYYGMSGCRLSGWRPTRGEADRAIYEAFADLNRHGFSWKTPKPDWSRYEVVTAWRRHISGEWYSESRNLPDALDLVIVKAFFNNAKDILGCYVSVIEGRLPDGSVEIIDRWEKEEKGK